MFLIVRNSFQPRDTIDPCEQLRYLSKSIAFTFTFLLFRFSPATFSDTWDAFRFGILSCEVLKLLWVQINCFLYMQVPHWEAHPWSSTWNYQVEIDLQDYFRIFICGHSKGLYYLHCYFPLPLHCSLIMGYNTQTPYVLWTKLFKWLVYLGRFWFEVFITS